MSGIRKYLSSREIEQNKIFEDEDWDLFLDLDDEFSDVPVVEKICRPSYGRIHQHDKKKAK